MKVGINVCLWSISKALDRITTHCQLQVYNGTAAMVGNNISSQTSGNVTQIFFFFSFRLYLFSFQIYDFTDGRENKKEKIILLRKVIFQILDTVFGLARFGIYYKQSFHFVCTKTKENELWLDIRRVQCLKNFRRKYPFYSVR